MPEISCKCLGVVYFVAWTFQTKTNQANVICFLSRNFKKIQLFARNCHFLYCEVAANAKEKKSKNLGSQWRWLDGSGRRIISPLDPYLFQMTSEM